MTMYLLVSLPVFVAGCFLCYRFFFRRGEQHCVGTEKKYDNYTFKL